MPIKCTKNKDRLSSPHLFLQAWAHAGRPHSAFSRAAAAGTVLGPPPSAAQHRPLVYAVCVSDHSWWGEGTLAGRVALQAGAVSAARRPSGLRWFNPRGR